jgi:hypothetical protein
MKPSRMVWLNGSFPHPLQYHLPNHVLGIVCVLPIIVLLEIQTRILLPTWWLNCMKLLLAYKKNTTIEW